MKLSHHVCESERKIADLIAHIIDLINQRESTMKVLTKDVILDERLVVSAESLEFDIIEHFRDLFKQDPARAHDISENHHFLQECFNSCNKVIFFVFAFHVRMRMRLML